VTEKARKQSRDAQKPVHGALIRRQPMLSTLVNPTDGHRFDGGAQSFAEGGAYLRTLRPMAAGRS